MKILYVLNQLKTLKAFSFFMETQNAFMANGFSQPHQLDQPISIFRVVGWYFSIFDRAFCKQTSGDPDQMLPMSHKKGTWRMWV